MPPWRAVTTGAKLFVLAIALLLALVGLRSVWSDRSAAIERSLENAENLSLLAARHAEDAIRAADVLLVGLREAAETGQLADRVFQDRLDAMLTAQAASLPQLGVLSVLDADGGTVMTNTPAVKAMTFADRDYFRATRESGGRGLIIGAPIVGRATQEWIIPLIRRIERPDGSFGGLVFGALRGDYFLHFYESLAIGRQGAVLLTSNTADPRLLVRRPFQAEAIGRSVSAGTIMRDLVPRAPSGRTEVTAVTDGIVRLAGYHRLESYPIVALVSFAKDEVLEPWREQATAALATLAGAAAAILLLGWLVIGQLERRIRSDEARRASERRFAVAFHDSPAPQAIRDEAGICVEVNAASVRIVGAPRAALVGRSPVETGIFTAAQWDALRARLARDGNVIDGLDYTIRTRDGGERTGLIFVAPLSIDDRPHTLWTFVDLTEQRRLETESRHAQKLQAIGQLTGGVAHDVNNLLAVIQGNVEQVEDCLGDPPAQWDAADLRACLQAAMRACRRGASLTRNLLAFARRERLEPQQFDPQPVLRETKALLDRTLPATITVTLAARGRWRCVADPGQLQNAVLNLALNARDAMPDGGLLALALDDVTLDAGTAVRHGDVAPGDYVAVGITDTGDGMAPELLGRVFEPFFTTKPVGQGSGLGLSMVYGFAKQSRGHVAIDSRPGRGTTVTLYLPRGREAAAAAPVPAEGGRGTGETVLLVEDDHDVRAVAARRLRQAGYRVLEAADAVAGLALVEAHAELALLLTDIVMPGTMSGRDLAVAARRRRPALAVLYMSGYADPVLPGDDPTPLLQKPFTQAELSAAVRTALGLRTPA